MFKTNFLWSSPKNIDDEFRFSYAAETTNGQYFEVIGRDALCGVTTYGRVHHPEWPIFIRVPMGHVGIKGRAVSMFRWAPDQDDLIAQIEANMDIAPFSHRVIHEDISIDWDSRTLFRVSNVDLLPPVEWYCLTAEWGLDMPTRFEAVGEDFGVVLIQNREPDAWFDQVARLPAGAEIELTRDQAASLTYIAPLGGAADIITATKTVRLESMEFATLTQDRVVVRAIEALMFLWRSKIA